MSDVLQRLAETIESRKASADPNASHTASLLAKGRLKCAEKFGEEAVEAVIAAAASDDEALICESADVIYHLAVMLAARDLSIADVLSELERREGVSGVAEKASRSAE